MKKYETLFDALFDGKMSLVSLNSCWYSFMPYTAFSFHNACLIPEKTVKQGDKVYYMFYILLHGGLTKITLSWIASIFKKYLTEVVNGVGTDIGNRYEGNLTLN